MSPNNTAPGHPQSQHYHSRPFDQFLPQHREHFKKIFWTTATQTQFLTEQDKNNFQKKYFDDYLNNFATFGLGLFHAQLPAGYILGCPNTALALDNNQLSQQLYPEQWLPLLCRYPAHFHLDLAQEHQGKKLGPWLLKQWLKMMHERNITGVHVITVKEHPSYHFYTSQNFRVLESMPRGQKNLVMLGLSLLDTISSDS